ncbi:Coenzyme F420 hydrogenase/dehydrogenase, beta subunit C-terminal domain [Sulfurovum mangrovi]|uniref:Coenzyme F420 hydrogenase/dehydrogenase, beta subunit C-terminal domain n=1 Tax=Sulfurovum mangrovi TaxID=2893889 RepID=UPI001E414002|nr:Coenzyme F420 hydrogenase/dehydrogenase, beta subunit C-terminal domain [Sulfurovum mangrovi]UFH59220.1 Coenzyme F420 hydrogenase/dehydrogenase, beta subunit C-terminal domain [Sulfurovum mangrovi]
MSFNIIQTTVLKDQCIGCGTCDAVCPVDVLKMDFNSIGMYEPIESEGCLDKCTLCMDACPFVEENKDEKELAKNIYENEDNILFHKDLGYFVNTYEVHKKDTTERLKSASGGAGHSLLKNLLEQQAVDTILTIESNNDPDKLFKFSHFKEIKELEKIRGSVYYPTEMSEVLDYVIKNDGKYAITTLPCFAKAIRLAQEKNSKLRKRIKFVIGLVCGQMKTKEFTHALAKNAIGTDRLKTVNFRVKQENKSAMNFGFEFTSIDQKKVNRLSNADMPSKLWGSRAFTPNACNSCTDVFAHCADIVLMDAWLPNYMKDYKGHSLVVARTNETSKILKNASDIDVKEIAYEKVFLSQKPVVDNKNAIYYGSKNIFTQLTNKQKLKIQKLSNINYEKNKPEIDLLFNKIRQIQKIYFLVRLPKRVVLKIFRILKGSR